MDELERCILDSVRSPLHRVYSCANYCTVLSRIRRATRGHVTREMADGLQVVEAKICLLGDQGVGKSSLVGRFVHGAFNPNLTTTLGASFMAKTIVVDNITYRFQIWDTAGQERYRSLLPMYYRNAAAAIVVYDITEERTFGVLKTWISELQRHGPNGIVIAIAGNKSDLEHKRRITREDGEEFAEQNLALFAETSALTASNVEEIFIEISRKLPKPKPLGESDKVVHLSDRTDEERSSCCGKK